MNGRYVFGLTVIGVLFGGHVGMSAEANKIVSDPNDPNQIVVIGTDGIWEMHNIHGEMFGKESLLKIIRDNASGTAQEILASILNAIHSFRGDNEPEDDITLIVMKAAE